MNIGIDITPLQSPHKMRGIGYTVLNLVKNIPETERKEHNFIFYKFSDENTSYDDPLNLLDVDSLSYEVRTIRKRRRFNMSLPWKFYLLNSIFNQLIDLRDYYFGDSRIKNLKGVDVFIQTDQSQSLPRKFGVKKVLILYDIIPYVIEWEYLWSYKTARHVHAFSRKAAFRCAVRRWFYVQKLKISVKKADLLLSISNQTKNDFVNLLSAPAKKVKVMPLGVVSSADLPTNYPVSLKRYVETGWGYIAKSLKLEPGTKFLLYVGGADKRRKLQDLVQAFNNLRAQGYELKLILAGDSMNGPKNIATEEIQSALEQSSYLSDVIFTGYIDDLSRSWLYNNAVAFVFPSRYEGFGLPILEAMTFGRPVICYPNQAVIEVAGDVPMYAENADDIVDSVKKVLVLSNNDIDNLRAKAIQQASKYSWESSSSNMLKIIGKQFAR